MIAGLMSLALMSAALLFLISLPFGESDAAKSLRRAAGFAFTLVFVPPLLGGLAQALVADARAPAQAAGLVFGCCGVLAIFVVLSFAAYGFLELRRRFATRQPAPHEQFRFGKRRSRDLFDATREDDDDEDHEESR